MSGGAAQSRVSTMGTSYRHAPLLLVHASADHHFACREFRKQKYVIDKSELERHEEIGQGAYGVVWRATWRDMEVRRLVCSDTDRA